MSHFIKKIAFLSFSIISFFTIVNIVFPIGFWTHRNWEALKYFKIRPGIGDFYPNYSSQIIEKGDLAYKTASFINKKCYWKIDNLGFRNDSVIKNIEVLFIGDSFVAGTSLSQDETISSILNRLSNKRTYQIAPGGIETFKFLLEQHLINKPKYVVYACCERSIPELRLETNNHCSKYSFRFQSARVSSRIVQNNLIFIDRFLKNSFCRYFKSKIFSDSGYTYRSPIEPKMFFFKGEKSRIEIKDTELAKIGHVIKSYELYFESIGVKLIFLPVPNKESLYWENVPFKKQPDFLFKLDTCLVEKGILSINLLKLYEENKNKGLIYHYDDSHWTVLGVKLAAFEVKKLISSN